MHEKILRQLTWCHNILRNEGQLSQEAAFYELNKFLYIKQIYEREESAENLIMTLKAYQSREYNDVLQEMFSRVKREYEKDGLFDESDTIHVRIETALKIMNVLRSFGVDKSLPVQGDAYEDYLKRVLKKSEMRYIIPQEVIAYIVEVLQLDGTGELADPFCGYGGILTGVTRSLNKNHLPHLYASENDRFMAQTANLNLTLHGINYSTLPKRPLDVYYVYPHKQYDVVITSLLHGERMNGKPIKETRMARALQMIREGGRGAFIVPDAVLSNYQYEELREYIVHFVDVKVITSFPQGILNVGGSALKPSVMILEKNKYLYANLTMMNRVKGTKDPSTGMVTAGAELQNKVQVAKDWMQRKKTEGNEYEYVYLKSLDNWSAESFFIWKENAWQSRYPIYKLRDLVEEVRSTRVDILDEKNYVTVTVRSKQHDVVVREELKGQQMKTKKMRTIKANQLLVSRIGGKDGAIGIVPEALDGAVVTENFMILQIKRELVVPYYLLYVMTSDRFKQVLKGISRGVTNMTYMNFRSLGDCEIPLPTLAEQRQLIGNLSEIQQKISKLEQDLDNRLKIFLEKIYGA